MVAPALADLEWYYDDKQGWLAAGTSAFWDIYNRNRAGFRDVGFCVSKPFDKWIVSGPDIHDGNRAAVRDLIAAVTEQAQKARMDYQAAMAPVWAEEKARQAERTARWAADAEARKAREAAHELVMHANSLRRAKRCDEARAAALACLDKWSTLVARKDKLRSLISLPLLTDPQLTLIHRLVRETGAKAKDLYVRAQEVRDDECVTWSDDVVDRAVRYLTGLDDDHAELPNEEGWSASDTGKGHWCVAVLETDRALALRLAKTFVGAYRRQLSAILTAEEMPNG